MRDRSQADNAAFKGPTHRERERLNFFYNHHLCVSKERKQEVQEQSWILWIVEERVRHRE